jgi:mono/diheme cytochrome c family protein
MVRLLVIVAALAALFVAWSQLRPELPAAERGRRLAEKMGCFGCHGPEGLHGAPNAGRADRTVPTFDADVMMMYAKSDAEIREWITTGATTKRRQSQSWRDQREKGALKMPAFGRRLSSHQVDDLVAFVSVMAGPAVPDSLARHGLARANQLGCTGCHGARGRFARRNPGSLKGYLPSWDGADFTELVHDSTEFHQWVEHGVSARFQRNPAARFFLGRAALHMPPFESHLEPGDVQALWAYVQWLRHSPRSPSGGEDD